MTGTLNNLNKIQMSTAVGSDTTSDDIATVRIADMIYVALPNLLDSRIFSNKVIGTKLAIYPQSH